MRPDDHLLQIGLLGPLRVEDGDRVLGPGDFGGIKPRALLEMLLLARGRPLSRDVLAEGLWGEDLPKSVAGALDTCVSVLRRCLTDDRDRGRRLIATEQGRYRFGVDHAALDLDRFDELLAGSDTVPRRQRRQLLSAALDLVHGDLVQDAPYAPWAEEERERYRGLVTEVRLRRGEDALAEGDADLALADSRVVVGDDPLNERAYRLSMLAWYARGRRDEAVRTYRRCWHTLAGELQLEPMDETADLMRAIEAGAPLADLLPADDHERPVQQVPLDRRDPRRQLPFLGRSSVLDRLETLEGASADGRFITVLVEGQRGTGRTRFLDELQRRLDGPVGRFACSPLQADVPFLAVRSVVQDAGRSNGATASVPDGVPTLSTDAVAISLQRLCELISRRGRMTLLVDDLQWADVASVTALDHLRRNAPALPVLVIATVCNEDAAWASGSIRIRVDEQFRLEPLVFEDVREVPRMSEDIFTLARGHAGLLSDIWRWQGDHRDGIPPSLSSSILRRARDLGGHAWVVVQVAAMLDEPFDAIEVMRHVDACASDVVHQLERLVENDVLEVTLTGYRFRYQVARQVLAASVSPARRALVEGGWRSAAERTLGAVPSTASDRSTP